MIPVIDAQPLFAESGPARDKVDAAIAKYGWRLVPITMTCDPDDIAPVLGQLFSERTCPSTDG